MERSEFSIVFNMGLGGNANMNEVFRFLSRNPVDKSTKLLWELKQKIPSGSCGPKFEGIIAGGIGVKIFFEQSGDFEKKVLEKEIDLKKTVLILPENGQKTRVRNFFILSQRRARKRQRIGCFRLVLMGGEDKQFQRAHAESLWRNMIGRFFSANRKSIGKNLTESRHNGAW